jgi:hypothetical protein
MFIPWHGEKELDVKYKKCIITYIDILGFKAMVDESISHAGTREGILHALRKIDSEVRNPGIFHVDDNERKLEGFEVRGFSDLIVRFRPLPVAADQDYAVFREILDICFAQAELLKHGTLIRGGMTIGDLYYDESHVFGPGIVRAYELESRLAIYPRVITESNILGDFPKYLTDNPPFIDHDSDGVPFLSYLSPNTFYSFGEIDYGALDQASAAIRWNLEETQVVVSSDRQKMIWVANKFNGLIQQLTVRKNASRGRLETLLIDPKLHAKSGK